MEVVGVILAVLSGGYLAFVVWALAVSAWLAKLDKQPPKKPQP